MIAGLLYVGYEYIADDAADVDQLLNTPLDTTGRELQPIPNENDQLTTTPETSKEDKSDTEAKDDKTTASSKDEEVVTPTTRPTDEEEPKKTEEKTPEKPKETPAPVAVNPGGVEITHTVQSGETFYGIANRYNLKSATLKGLNPVIKDETTDVKSGVTRIKVRVQAVHTVGPGDILRVVAEKYGVTVQQLMAANKKTKNFTERGEKLIIPFPEKK